MNVVSATVAPLHDPTPSKSMQTPSPPRLPTTVNRLLIRLLQAVGFVRSRWLAAEPNSVAVSTTFTPLLWAHSTTGLVFQEWMLS